MVYPSMVSGTVSKLRKPGCQHHQHQIAQEAFCLEVFELHPEIQQHSTRERALNKKVVYKKFATFGPKVTLSRKWCKMGRKLLVIFSRSTCDLGLLDFLHANTHPSI